MNRHEVWLGVGLLCLSAALCLQAQQTDSSGHSSQPTVPTQGSIAGAVPRLIQFSGAVKDGAGKVATGSVSVTFSLYELQEGGAPLWSETQSLALDEQGRYTVLLGASTSEGVPLDLFTSGQARWLGIQPQLPGVGEQARVLLVGVPYALKAADADTLGGKPVSAFVLAQPEATARTGSTGRSALEATTGTRTSASINGGDTKPNQSTKAAVSPNTVTANYIPVFTNNAGTLGNSTIFQGSSGNLGIGYSNPTNARVVIASPAGGGVLNTSNLVDQDMFVTLSAPGASDKHAYFGPSTPTNLTLGVGGVERMRITNAGNVGIGYSNPQQRVVIGAPAGGGVLNTSNLVDQDVFVTLSAPGASDKHAYLGPSTPTNLTLGVGGVEKMRITNAGNVGIGTTTPGAILEVNGTAKFDQAVTFVSGQVFPGTATLGPNMFVGTQSIASGDLSVSGDLYLPVTTDASAGVVYMGGSAFIHACCFIRFNTFVGSNAGNFGTTGSFNTAYGNGALRYISTGFNNTASGFDALMLNSTGLSNTASGANALYSNTTGSSNTASGYYALYSNTTAYANTATGVEALASNTTGDANTATGDAALTSNTTGTLNTASGDDALFANTSGNGNTATGQAALQSNLTGSYNTGLGAFADLGSGDLTNATAIGACAVVSSSNALVLGAPAGGGGVNCSGTVTANTSVGIDVGNPSNIFTVLQGGGHAIADGWDTYSSRRWKSDIHTLHGALGKIGQLRGVEYTYTATGQHDIGMIAEEVGEVVPEVVSYEDNGKDARGIDYARLTALLVEAVKQQQKEIRQQQAQISREEAQISQLKSEVRALERKK